jgi:hypothetical protein
MYVCVCVQKHVSFHPLHARVCVCRREGGGARTSSVWLYLVSAARLMT